MADPIEREMDLATSAHAVLMAWERGDLDEAVSNLGEALADWLRANELRMCDGCGATTNAGEAPDWINGQCEDCDPTVEDEPEDPRIEEAEAERARRDAELRH